METSQEKNVIRVDNYTRVCLTVIAGLLTVLIIGLWADISPRARQAEAAEQFLNTAAQRRDIVAAVEKTNAKMDQLLGLFRSGQAKVTIAQQKSSKTTGAAENVSSKTKKP